MRPSSLSVGLALAGALGALLVACGDPPTDPAVSFGHIDKGAGHPRPIITVLSQPAVNSIANPDFCAIPYSFEISGKGKERELTLRWRTRWWGGDHHGMSMGTNVVTVTLGTNVEGVVISPIAGHFNDGHSFDAFRILLTDPADENLIYAEAFTEGATVSC